MTDVEPLSAEELATVLTVRAITMIRATISELTKERDETRDALRMLESAFKLETNELIETRARAESAEAEVKRLREALKPFAKYAAIAQSDGWKLIPDYSVINAPNEGAQRHHIMMSDFIRAHEALLSPTPVGERMIISDDELKALCKRVLTDGHPVSDDTAKQLAQWCLDRLRTQGWQPIETAPKDGTEIIYWNTTSSTKGEGFVSSCVWRDADEGVQEGWWDDSVTEIIEPSNWLMPLPKKPKL